MRILNLSKTGLNKLRSHGAELKFSDFQDPIRSITPGEWCLFQSGPEAWVGFVNPTVEEKFVCAYVLEKSQANKSENFSVEELIEEKITSAWNKRERIKDYGKCSRIFYGASDGLPGLIIDHFENALIIQINTAGIDRYRDLIKEISQKLASTPAYFLDNPRYREKEYLPVFENPPLPELKVIENDLGYVIRAEVLQKVGFYYDHRENRRQLTNLICRLAKTPALGLDLFCYAGAWGISALKAGVKKMAFIDQGDFGEEVNSALRLNGFEGQGEFIRSDVFKFLEKEQKYDLILCDPPAFAKSSTQKAQALEGYSKLHRRVFRSLSQGSLVAFSSCTQYVNHEEFQKNILEAAHKESRRLQLIYSGIQGFDHPISSLADRANYIKSYFYLVE